MPGQEMNSNDNFEIDEIILAPQLEDSTTESEDDDDDSYNSNYRKITNGVNGLTAQISEDPCSLANSFYSYAPPVAMDSSIKVRQLVSKGPQDLLYCSYTNLEDNSESIAGEKAKETQKIICKFYHLTLHFFIKLKFVD